jgi:multiple sugar transport system ATP-binding protein
LGETVTLGIRPEHLSRATPADRRPGLVQRSVVIELVQPTGSRTYATFRIGDTPVVAELQAHDVSQPGETLELSLDMNRAIIIDTASGEVLT